LVSAGSRSIQAAVMSGLFFFIFPAVLDKLFAFPGNWVVSNPDAPSWVQSLADAVQPTWAQSVAFILFGIGAITYAKHPEGSIEAQTSASVNAIVRRVERRKAASSGSAPSGPSGPATPSTNGSGPATNGSSPVASPDRSTTGTSA